MVERPQTIIPNPDPSEITSQAIDRRVEGAIAVVSARINGMEKAVEVFQADLTRVPTQLDRAIQGLRELLEARLRSGEMAWERFDVEHQRLLAEVKGVNIAGQQLGAVTEQRFKGVAEQLYEREVRFNQRVEDGQLAIDAAFAAAKEATSKIEAGFTKSIDALQELLKATTKSSDEKISDLKDRMTALENRTAGISSANQENRSVSHDSSARVLASVGIAVALAVGLGQILARLVH